MTMTFESFVIPFSHDGGPEIVAVSDHFRHHDIAWVWVADSVSCRLDGHELGTLHLDDLKVPYTPETLTAYLTQFYSERENYNGLQRRVREHLTELDLARPF